MFLHVQSTQTSRVDNLYFFQMSFFPTKCAPFLLKIGEYFNTGRAKILEPMNYIYVYNQFKHIWFKCAFDLQNYGF